MYELAEHLHMSVSEMCYGRGMPMSAHELTVGWPAYRQLVRERQEAQAEKERHTRRGR